MLIPFMLVVLVMAVHSVPLTKCMHLPSGCTVHAYIATVVDPIILYTPMQIQVHTAKMKQEKLPYSWQVYNITCMY